MMRGQSIGLLVLALALSAALVLSGCGGGGGDDGGGGSPRIVYVYKADTTTADGFADLLAEEGYDFSTVQKADVEATDFRAYDLIIVSDDSFLTGSTWGTEVQAAALLSSGRPVIGLGEGGSIYFGQVGLVMGHYYTSGYKFNNVYIVDGDYPIWSGVGVTDQTVELYNTAEDLMNWTRCLYAPEMTSAVTLIGRHPSLTAYYSLARSGNCFYWAYPGPVSDMTDAGKTVFLNVVKLMI